MNNEMNWIKQGTKKIEFKSPHYYQNHVSFRQFDAASKNLYKSDFDFNLTAFYCTQPENITHKASQE
jgi:hypothetical protein